MIVLKLKFSLLILVVIFISRYNSIASLPELESLTPPTIISLPQTFSYGGTNSGYFDIDGDESWDLRFYFDGDDLFKVSCSWGSSIIANSGGNMINLLPSGTGISLTAPTGLSWLTWGVIAKWSTGFPFSPTKGYVGVNFGSGSDMYYGWANVEINHEDETVTVKSVGYNEIPDAPVLAGAGDPFGSTVPIPFIASAVAMVLAGAGIVYRRKRKK